MEYENQERYTCSDEFEDETMDGGKTRLPLKYVNQIVAEILDDYSSGKEDLETQSKELRSFIREVLAQDVIPGDADDWHNLTVDIARHQIFKGDEEIHFTQNEFKIIELLAIHAGKVLTYDFILEHVWGPFSGSNGNQILRVNMANIRRKLGVAPGENKYIVNELGVGYRMNADE